MDTTTDIQEVGSIAERVRFDLDQLLCLDPEDNDGAGIMADLLAIQDLQSYLHSAASRRLAVLARPGIAGDPSRLVARRMTENPMVAELSPEQRQVVRDGETVLVAEQLAVAQLGAVLKIAPATASRRVHEAIELVDDLPGTLDALIDGRIDRERAKVLADRSAVLSPALRRELERRVLPEATECTPRQWRNLVDAEIIVLDPTAAEQRRRDAVERRRLRLESLDDGVAKLVAELPAHQAQLAWDLFDAVAEGLRGFDERTLDQRRADAFVTIVELLAAGETVSVAELLGRPDRARHDTCCHPAHWPDLPTDPSACTCPDPADASDASADRPVVDHSPINSSGSSTCPDAVDASDESADRPAADHSPLDSSDFSTCPDAVDGFDESADRAAADHNPIDSSICTRPNAAKASEAADWRADDRSRGEDADKSAETAHRDDSGSREGSSDCQCGGGGPEPDPQLPQPVGEVGLGLPTTPTDHPSPGWTSDAVPSRWTDNSEQPEDLNGSLARLLASGSDVDNTDPSQGGRVPNQAEMFLEKSAVAPPTGRPTPSSAVERTTVTSAEAVAAPAGGSAHPPWTMPTRQGRQIHATVVLTLDALAGLAADPARLDGQGIITAEYARALARSARTISLLVVDESGRPVVAGERAYRPTQKLRDRVMSAYPTCVFVGCGRKAASDQLDHRQEYDLDEPGNGGPTDDQNLFPLCLFHHRLKTFAGWTYRPAEPGGLLRARDRASERSLFGRQGRPAALVFRSPLGIKSVSRVDQVVRPRGEVLPPF